jgi:hypothetical protein
MGAEGTRKREWAAENSLVGPASRALATPPRTPRSRLPSLQGFAFDEEERNTDSEIDNVLGGFKSIPPKPGAAPVIAASDAAYASSRTQPVAAPRPAEPASMEPLLEAPLPPTRVANAVADLPHGPSERPSPGDHAATAPRAPQRRRMFVLTAVCAFCAVTLALAAVLRIARGRAEPDSSSVSQAAAEPAPTPTLTPSSPPAAADDPTQAAPTVPPSVVTPRAPAAAPQKNAGARRPPSKRTYNPRSI